MLDKGDVYILSYNITKASKLIINEIFIESKTDLGKRLVLLNMLEDRNIIYYYKGDNRKFSKKWVLNHMAVKRYPQLSKCFEEKITDNGYYQLMITDYGEDNLMDIIYYIIDMEDDE